MDKIPMKGSIYIVEERYINKVDWVTFAWDFDNQEDAEERLLKEVREHGHERFYTAYRYSTEDNND